MCKNNISEKEKEKKKVIYSGIIESIYVCILRCRWYRYLKIFKKKARMEDGDKMNVFSLFVYSEIHSSKSWVLHSLGMNTTGENCLSISKIRPGKWIRIEYQEKSKWWKGEITTIFYKYIYTYKNTHSHRQEYTSTLIIKITEMRKSTVNCWYLLMCGQNN